ncbi:MAG: GerMN domain-containing protein [Epulopiscium sp.]|nr:GerMN domain-containing protein [Candidatus Epulonipiscium sp.]
MRSKNKTALIFIFIFSLILLISLVSCKMSNNKQDKNKDTQVILYFIDGDKSQLKEEKRLVNLESKEDLIKYSVEELKKMPKTVGLQPSIPQDIKINTMVLEGNTLKVDISSQYKDLSAQKQVLLRASLVKSLTEFDFVDLLEIMIEGEPLLGADGKAIGPMSKEDIVLEPSNAITKASLQNVKLYFSSNNAEKLVPEERQIEINPNISLEKYIVEQLILGPNNKELIMTVPPETTIKDIETKDGICYVDLSNEFRTKHWGGSTGETMTIYSIVNSLTELPNVKKVQFLIEGEKQQEFKGHYDFSGLFDRDENLIR